MPWPWSYLWRPLRRPRINRKPIFRSAPGGAAGARSAHKAGAGGPKGPLPLLWFGRAGGPKAPRPAKHRRPPWERCGLRFPPGPSSSATPPIPLRFPVPFRPIFSRNTPARNRCNFPASPRIPRAYPPFFFPPINRHTPKAFWKPAEGWFPGPSDSQPLEKHPSLALHPGSGPHPSVLPFRFATSQGSGGGAAPSRGPGARPPLAMRS